MSDKTENPLYTLQRIISNVICNAPMPCGNKFSVSVTTKERELINEKFKVNFLSENSVELGGNIWNLYIHE